MAVSKSSILPAEEVEYLVFSGGGGKCVVHIGAVLGMERLLKRGKPIANRRKCLATALNIQGFAGSSGGALIAMLLAMECRAKQIYSIVADTFGRTASNLPSIIADADEFLRPPGKPLKVTADLKKTYLLPRPVALDGRIFYKQPEYPREVKAIDSILKEIAKDLYVRESLANYRSLSNKLYAVEALEDFANGVLGTEASLLEITTDKIYDVFKKWAKGTDFEFITRNRSDFNLYYFNYLFHEGLTAGLNLNRSVIASALRTPLYQRTKFNVEELTFQNLYDLNGIDLVVTGTRLGQKSNYHYFSRDFTPNFPIVTAVTVSTNYPFLFKPIMLHCKTPGKTDTCKHLPKKYTGKWVDGGLLNNLPLHAFDRGRDRPLNPYVVAFGLTLKPDFRSRVTVPEILKSNIDQVMQPLLAQSSDGQIRTEFEEQQVLELSADGLSTLDLVPNWEVAGQLIVSARKATMEYFEKPVSCFPLTKVWGELGPKKDPPDPVDPIALEVFVRQQMRAAFVFVSPRPLSIVPYLDKKGTKEAGYSFSADLVATNARRGKGEFVVYEIKSTINAPLTALQKRGIVCLAQFGGYISSSLDRESNPNEAAHFPKGAKISPQTVRILRPGNLCEEFELAVKTKGMLKELAKSLQAADWRGQDFPDLKGKCY